MLDWDGEFVIESWRLGLEIPRFHLICCSILHMTSYPTRSISDTGAFCLPHLVYLVIVPMIFVLLPSEDCTGCCSMPILFLWILGWICSLDAASIKNRHILSEAKRGAASETHCGGIASIVSSGSDQLQLAHRSQNKTQPCPLESSILDF